MIMVKMNTTNGAKIGGNNITDKSSEAVTKNKHKVARTDLTHGFCKIDLNILNP